MATPSSLVQELGHLVAALAASPGIAVEHTASAAELASLLAGTSALLSADGFEPLQTVLAEPFPTSLTLTLEPAR